MAICGNCGAESTRLRTFIYEDATRDECPACAPQSFEKITDPSDKKIWIGPETRPNDYEKRYDSDGVFYMPKPEATAELERKAFKEADYDEKYAAAVERKRKNRCMRNLTPLEVASAIAKANSMFEPLITDPNTNYDA